MVCWLGRSLVGLLVFRSRSSPLVLAVCIHSLPFLSCSGCIWIISCHCHCHCHCSFPGWIMSTLCRLLYPAHPGFRCSTSLWLSTNMAGARGFCLFLFGTGVLGSKRVSPSSHSKFLFGIGLCHGQKEWGAGKRQKSSWSLI
ncbi:uncharacterized protein BDW70DRAFT_101615 [Aspergillus foveolatus]|uniref:uncharacterized protein n=1 Tax=Aspergillus foveolatus TaxID=210207 RepID=UPI003CCD1CC7